MLKNNSDCRLTIDRISDLLGIMSPDTFFSRNVDCCQCETAGQEAWDYSRNEYVIAKFDYTCESCSFDYYGKVEKFAKTTFDHFNLDLVMLKDGNYKLVPKTSWQKSMQALIEVINGYGLFEFNDIQDALLSGPYPNEHNFIMNHLGWVKEYYNVYEGSSAKSMFESLR